MHFAQVRDNNRGTTASPVDTRQVLTDWSHLMARMPRAVTPRDALIEENIGLVVHIANRVANRLPHERDRDDLISAGLIGLVEAATRFDPSRELPFSSFAGMRIEGAILDSLRQADRLPRSVRQTQRQIEAAEIALTTRLGRTPSAAEVAHRAGLSRGELHEARTMIAAGIVESLDRVTADDATSFAELVADACGIDDQLAEREAAAVVRAAVLQLPERHRFVILGCMFEGRPLRELAVTLGVTRSRVSQLKDEAIRQLRVMLVSSPSLDLHDNPTSPHGRRARGPLAMST